MWRLFILACTCASLTACRSPVSVIGYIATEPVSIELSGAQSVPVIFSVHAISDSIRLSAPGQSTYVVHDIRRTTEQALSNAFASTTKGPSTSPDKSRVHELRLIAFGLNYNPMGYYANSEIKDNPLTFGPRSTTSTTMFRPYSIDAKYKATLHVSDSLVAVFEEVVNSPGVWDMESNLREAIERMAETLNTEVVQFLLRRKGE